MRSVGGEGSAGMPLPLGAMKALMIAIFVVVSLHVSSTRCDPDNGDFDYVINVTSSNFDTLTSDGVWFVEFFAPWCGHCQKFAPTWKEVGAVLKDVPNLHVGRIDCTESSDLGSQFSVDAFPTIMLLRKGGEFAYEYTGRRTLQAMTKWAESMAREAVPTVDANQLDTFLTTTGWPIGFVFFAEDATPEEKLIIENSGEKFLKLASVVSIDSTPNTFKGVVSSPSIAVFQKNSIWHKLERPLTPEKVDAFIERYRFPWLDRIRTNNSDSYLSESSNKLVVLGIVNTEKYSSYLTFLEELEGIAKELNEDIAFAWMDVAEYEWSRWLQMTENTDNSFNKLKKIIIFDPQRSIYYESTGVKLDKPETKELIKNFIKSVIQQNFGKEVQVKGEGLGWVFRGKKLFKYGFVEFRKDFRTQKLKLTAIFISSALISSVVIFLILNTLANRYLVKKTKRE